jgi:hypothetical protein
MGFDRVYPVYYEISFELETENELERPQEAQARFARARLCLPYNEGRKEILRPKLPRLGIYVTRNYPRFFAFNAFLSRLIDIPCKNDTV